MTTAQAHLYVSSASRQTARAGLPRHLSGGKNIHKWLRDTLPLGLESLHSYLIPSEDIFCCPMSKAVVQQSHLYCWLQSKVSRVRFSLCLLFNWKAGFPQQLGTSQKLLPRHQRNYTCVKWALKIWEWSLSTSGHSLQRCIWAGCSAQKIAHWSYGHRGCRKLYFCLAA